MVWSLAAAFQIDINTLPRHVLFRPRGVLFDHELNDMHSYACHNYWPESEHASKKRPSVQFSSVVPPLFEHIITDHVKQSWCVGVEVCDIPYSGRGNAGHFLLAPLATSLEVARTLYGPFKSPLRSLLDHEHS